MEYEFLVESEAAKELADGITTSPVFRSKLTDGELVKDIWGNRTVYDLFTSSCDKFANRHLHGKRVQYVDGTVGEFVWQSYADVQTTVSDVSKGMRLLGCQAGAKIGIYSPNTPEWVQAMLACSYFSAVCVPMYDTVAANAVEYAIVHGEIEFIFVSEKNCRELGNVIRNMGTKANQIREICIWADYTEVKEAEMRSAIQIFKDAGIQVENWVDLIQRGRASQADSIQTPSPATDPETMAVLMYTSGTTGVPKGVVISNRAIIATVAAAVIFTKKGKLLPQNGAHLSWLTCAHIYGFVMELVSIVAGAKVGYWQGDPKKILEDVSTLKPTQFLSVPRVWVRIVDKIKETVEKSGIIAKYLFDWGYSYKKSVLESGSEGTLVTWMIDYFLFSKLLAHLGGEVLFLASGAAPLPKHVEEFLRVTFPIPVMQGYGLTETCAFTSVSVPGRYDQLGTVGVVTPCAEFRLESVPELGYNAQGSPASGEICFRGPCLFTGYNENEEEYNKVVDKDGFFHTGDIGELQSCGSIRIIDRKKNIFKLSQGEYVAVERIESILQQASSVEQIWVYGDSCQPFLVAIVYPNANRLRHLVRADASLEDICRSEAAKREVLKELSAVGKESGLKGFERAHDIGLVPEDFTVENGLMTPSQKLKRHDLLRRYKSIIDSLYSESPV